MYSLIQPCVFQSEIWETYSIVELIGVGSYGTVYLSKQTDGSLVAMKILRISSLIERECNMESLRNEILMHYQVKDCDGIVDMKELFIDEDMVYLILDYQQKGSLLSIVHGKTQFTEIQVK